MEAVRRAVIDVGTNSIKLLVADVAGHEVRPVVEESKQTRLGRGFYETHRLQPEAIAQTAKAVCKFAELAREQQATSIRVIATSAARDAINPKDLTSALEEASGLKVEIISGEQEADWAFQGATTDPQLAREPLLLLDVGGGSTEFIVGRGEQKHFRQSFPLGTVRLMEKMPHSDPPTAQELAACRQWLKEFLQNQVQPKLAPAMRKEVREQLRDGEKQTPRPGPLPIGGGVGDGRVQFVGTGGTATILARMEGEFDG